jgi:flagellar hook protein FlgE
MSTLTSIASSGMQAAQVRLNSSAHNIANLSTEGFHRQEVQTSQREGGGVNAAVSSASAAGSALETDVVEQLQAKNAFLANLKVFKTANKLAGALLDKSA